MEIKPVNLKLRRDQRAKKLNCSGSLQRYSQDINMLSPYRISQKKTKDLK